MKDYAKFTKKDDKSPIHKIILGTIISVPLRILEIPRLCANLPKREKWVMSIVMSIINLILIFANNDPGFRIFQLIIEVILIAYIAMIWNPKRVNKVDFEPPKKVEFTKIEEEIVAPVIEEEKPMTLADLAKGAIGASYEDVMKNTMDIMPNNMQDMASLMGGMN